MSAAPAERPVRLLPVAEVAELLGVSDWTVYQLARRPDGLRSIQVTRRAIRFHPEDVLAYINGSRQGGPR